jgi:hypothetical protein
MRRDPHQTRDATVKTTKEDAGLRSKEDAGLRSKADASLIRVRYGAHFKRA